jgi:hypothetical protein
MIIILQRAEASCFVLCCVNANANFFKRGPTDGFFTKIEALLKVLILIHKQPQQQQHKHDGILIIIIHKQQIRIKNNTMAEDLIRIQCPIWERSSQPGILSCGSIAIDSLKRLLVYDDIRWPSAPFP